MFHHAAKAVQGEVWISAIEHPCVMEAARVHFGERRKLLPVTTGGGLDTDFFRAALAKGKPGLVAVMAANNETGVLQPWRDVRELCAEHGVPFFCDAAQWVGKLPATGLGECDFVSGCAHKSVSYTHLTLPTICSV